MAYASEEINITVDGKQLCFLTFKTGSEYEISASAISDIRIVRCMRSLEQISTFPTGTSEPLIDLTVRLGTERLPWETNLGAAFFLFNSTISTSCEIICSFNTGLGSHEETLTEIISPLIQNTPFTLRELRPWAEEPAFEEDGRHTWELAMLCSSEDASFRDFLRVRKLLSQAVFLPSEVITNPFMARRMLQLGQAEKFLGHQESEWLEVKSSPYEFKAVHDLTWKLQLAKDVAQFANSNSGGILIIGFHTKRLEGIDTIDKITPFPYNDTRLQTYRDVLKARIHPPISGLEIDMVRNDDLCIVYAYIPPQSEENKPYLIVGSSVDGELESLGITIVRRNGDSSIPVTAQELHSMIAVGRAFLRGSMKP